MSSTHIVLIGASGRMGRRIGALAQLDARVSITAAIARDGSSAIGQRLSDAPDALIISASTDINTPADVVIDFSSPTGHALALHIALKQRSALLVGTTGLDPSTIAELRQASKLIPVLLAPNTSLGVAALSSAAASLASMLGSAFTCSIVEAHHSAKKDAPSGTALRLADAVRRGGGQLDHSHILSIRGGDTVGEHFIRFDGPGESIELTHRAVSRDLFARGAITAALWLKGRQPGWYTIDDVVGIPTAQGRGGSVTPDQC